MMNYESNIEKLKSKLKLYKPSVATIIDLQEDFKLGEMFEEKIEIKYFVGDHVTILNNSNLALEINKDLGIETKPENKEILISVERITNHQDAVKPWYFLFFFIILYVNKTNLL